MQKTAKKLKIKNNSSSLANKNLQYILNLKNTLNSFVNKNKNKLFWNRLYDKRKKTFFRYEKQIFIKIFPKFRRSVISLKVKRYFKFFNGVSLKNTKLKILKKYIFYYDYFKKLKLEYKSNSFSSSLFSLKILSRYYLYLGYIKTNVNAYWGKYLLGNYFKISIINLNFTYSMFKKQNNIFFSLLKKNLNFLKLLIFDNVLNKKNLFSKFNCFFGSNYYINNWHFGYLTNPLLRYEVKNKKFFFRSFRAGGLPILLFFTHIHRDAYLSFLNEFFLLKIPVFGLIDTNAKSTFIDYPIFSNSKNKFSRIFYLKILSKLFLNISLTQNKVWLSKLKTYYFGFILRLKYKIKILKRKEKYRKLKKVEFFNKSILNIRRKFFLFLTKNSNFLFRAKAYYLLKIFKNLKKNKKSVIKLNHFKDKKLMGYISYIFRRKTFNKVRSLEYGNLNKKRTNLYKNENVTKIFFLFRLFFYFILKKKFSKKANFFSLKIKKYNFFLFSKFLLKVFFLHSTKKKIKKSSKNFFLKKFDLYLWNFFKKKINKFDKKKLKKNRFHKKNFSYNKKNKNKFRAKIMYNSSYNKNKKKWKK